MNNITLLGRFTKDPKLEELAKQDPKEEGIKYTRFFIACDDGNSKNKKSASFFTVEAWNKLAEVITKYFKKGDLILLNGTIKQRKFKTKKGDDVVDWVVYANEFSFIPGTKKDKKENNEEQTTK